MIRTFQLAANAVGLADHPDKTQGKKRSGKWPKVRDTFLAGRTCAACGGRKELNAHHIRPFNLFPELELDTTNLIALCEKGPGSTNCHALVGHCGDWRAWNPHVTIDAARLLAMFGARRYAA